MPYFTDTRQNLYIGILPVFGFQHSKARFKKNVDCTTFAKTFYKDFITETLKEIFSLFLKVLKVLGFERFENILVHLSFLSEMKINNLWHYSQFFLLNN